MLKIEIVSLPIIKPSKNKQSILKLIRTTSHSRNNFSHTDQIVDPSKNISLLCLFSNINIVTDPRGIVSVQHFVNDCPKEIKLRWPVKYQIVLGLLVVPVAFDYQ